MTHNRKLKIFIIEDDEDIRSSIQTIFESDGYIVEAFPDGKSALARLRINPNSCLVFLDLVMPLMNGWEFMSEFAKLPITIVPIPVYILSVTKELEGYASKVGARGFIKKPVNLDVLLQIANEHCEEHKVLTDNYISK